MGHNSLIGAAKARSAAAGLLALWLVACGGESETPTVPEPQASAPVEDTLPASDGPLSIAGAPETTALAFGYYEFTPEATHRDDRAVSFGIENRPGWAVFDPQTGTLSGFPEFADEGTYASILITASDGDHTVAVDRFEIRVVIPELTSVTISWIAPATRMDGSLLENLDFFTVHYGTEPDRLPHVVEVDASGAPALFIEHIPAGRTYYFAVRAVDAFGQASRLSRMQTIGL